MNMPLPPGSQAYARLQGLPKKAGYLIWQEDNIPRARYNLMRKMHPYGSKMSVPQPERCYEEISCRVIKSFLVKCSNTAVFSQMILYSHDSL
ncbi:hypothetical protein NVR66_14615 [Enterobacter bugandensis]|uniref:hypothetical protein n=1 Tax=Enterobacter bugandensis TaxID=881260 RepID=UPI0023AEC063|nr:hypothetical protein [Enterobacter bugandensis]MDE7590862.1 hypothetical protein [Enterobacter bugandensis]